MKYVKMNEEMAVEKGVISETNYFPKKDGEVLFKKDLLTIWQEQGNQIDFEYQELSTAEALNIIESWE